MRANLHGPVRTIAVVAGIVASTSGLLAQPELPDGPPAGRRGGPGVAGPMAEERKLVQKFDADADGRLDADERLKAREFIRQNPQGRRPGGGRGGPGGAGGEAGEQGSPGPRVAPSEVKPAEGELYDVNVLRTFFLDFEREDWESELQDFYNTDVEVPATLTIDGVEYPGVGVSFRGASSYFTVGAGQKRSLNVSVDFENREQRVAGKKTLNLLNSHSDPSMMSTVLYSRIARQHIAAPRANFARVVINGESWGVYVNVEQFDKIFVQENFEKGSRGDSGGARWKVKGSPNGASGLDSIGDDTEAYKRRYQIKSGDREKDWTALVELCRILTETPIDELEAKLAPVLDIEGVLWFLALDAVLVNMDGYWVRASDYSIYRDTRGVFHIVPHDMNEAFSGSMGGPRGGPGGRPRGGPGGDGPGGRGSGPGRPDGPGPGAGPPPRELGAGERGAGTGGNGYELDPLIGMDDARKPLRSRLLAVPSLRARYLDMVRHLARESLDWEKLGPIVSSVRATIDAEVKADTRKLSSYAAFDLATGGRPVEGDAAPRSRSLRSFADRRRAYLLGYQPPATGVPAGTWAEPPR